MFGANSAARDTVNPSTAALAKFLITEDSSWMTGQIIAVDGGRSKLS